MFMWGLNKSGQCGFPVSAGDSLVEPKLLDSEHWGNERVAQIVLGRTHSALRTASGAIYAWGKLIHVTNAYSIRLLIVA